MEKKTTRAERDAKWETPQAYIARVNAVALLRLESLCREWTSKGKRIGHEYVALNPQRAGSARWQRPGNWLRSWG